MYYCSDGCIEDKGTCSEYKTSSTLAGVCDTTGTNAFEILCPETFLITKTYTDSSTQWKIFSIFNCLSACTELYKVHGQDTYTPCASLDSGGTCETNSNIEYECVDISSGTFDIDSYFGESEYY